MWFYHENLWQLCHIFIYLPIRRKLKKALHKAIVALVPISPLHSLSNILGTPWVTPMGHPHASMTFYYLTILAMSYLLSHCNTQNHFLEITCRSATVYQPPFWLTPICPWSSRTGLLIAPSPNVTMCPDSVMACLEIGLACRSYNCTAYLHVQFGSSTRWISCLLMLLLSLEAVQLARHILSLEGS